MVRPRSALNWAAWTSILCWCSERWTVNADAGVLSVPAGDFLGDDGDYTAFEFQVGTPPQTLSFFPSTSSSQFLLQLKQGCPATIPNCAQQRGGIYDDSSSSSWDATGQGQVLLEQAVNITVAANHGSETIGFDGISVENQAVSEITQTPYWVGVAGLHIWDNASSADNGDQTDFISSLKDHAKAIPSLSFGYTAGASYQLKGVPGSLTFGGYDQARFDPTKMMVVDFNNSDTRDLALKLATIDTTINGNFTALLPNPIDILIDTTLTDIWLPTAACKEFESAFNIKWNSTSQFYYINPDDHAALQKADPNVTFSVVSPDGSSTMDLTLSYSAFDQTANWPRYDNFPNTISYFPLRRANNTNQYILGRAFFQEVYLFVNFENGTFTLSPTVFSETAGPNLFSLYPNGTTVGSSASAATGGAANGANSGGSGGGGVSGSTIGIAVGVTLGVLLLLAIGAYLWYRNRRKKRAAVVSEKAQSDITARDEPNGVGRNGVGPKDEMNTGIDHEIYEAGSPHGGPGFAAPANATELDGAAVGGATGPGELEDKKRDVGTDAAALRARRAELGTSFSGAELGSEYSGAELGSHYSGAELEGSPITSAVEIQSIPSPSLSALRSGTVSPMTAGSPGPGSPRMMGQPRPHNALEVPSPLNTRPGTAAAQHGAAGAAGSGTGADARDGAVSSIGSYTTAASPPSRPRLERNPSSMDPI